MKKTGVFVRIAALLWICTVATAGLWVSGTTAKYVASAKVQAEGEVALWKPVWIPRSDATAGTTAGGLGNSSAGVMFHPGNWTTTKSVNWRAYNNGEVTMQSRMTLMVTTGVQATGGTSVGTFYPNNPARQVLIRATHFPLSTITPNTGVSVSGVTGALQTIRQGGNSFNFSFSILGYATANVPARPTGSGAYGTGAITKADPIQYRAITGSNSTAATDPAASSHPTYNVSGIWRTTRINADGYSVQVD